jgi:phospholipase/carboxylesterase
MANERYGELTVRLSGADRDGGGDGPLVVLFHGYGAPAEDLVPLARVMHVPDGTRFAFPGAPIQLPMGFGDARAWWQIDVAALEQAMASGELRDLSGAVPDGLLEARELAKATLTALVDALGPSRVVLGGFSQGAMLALDLALHTDIPLAGVVLMSGTLLSEDEWRARLPDRKGLRVFQSHGKLDPLLSFDLAERLHEMLDSGGLPVTFVPFRGAHEIPPPVLTGVEAFLGEVLS